MKYKTIFRMVILHNLFLILAIFLILNCSSEKSPPPVMFTRSPQIFTPAATNQIGLGDLDSDGDLDAVFSNQGRNYSQVYLNDGTGHFTDSGQKLTQQGHGVGIGDLDSDGDLDLFITCAGWSDEKRIRHQRPSKIYLNNGHGIFKDTGQDLGDTKPSGNGITLVDIDADGDLDAHIFYYKVSGTPYYHLIYLNNGMGRFQRSEIKLPEGSYPFWCDLNGDGFADVFLLEWGKGLRVMMNDGKTHFIDRWQIPDTTIQYGDAALGDFDSDGDLDAIVANGGGTRDDSTRVFFNDGTGNFTDSGQKLNPTKWAGICLGDLNGDGTIDAYVNNYMGANEVWLNNGKGYFIDSGLRMCENETNGMGSIGDLDGDGDLDVFVAFYGDGSNSIWINMIK